MRSEGCFAHTGLAVSRLVQEMYSDTLGTEGAYLY